MKPHQKITPLSKKDKNLLEKMVDKIRPKSIGYEDSWGYVIQAARNNGFKWMDLTKEILIFFGEKPNDKNILVVPSFFADPESLVSIFSEIMALESYNKIILKNIDPLDVEKFLPYGFRKYNTRESWDKSAKYDDQTYPQPIINLSNTIEMMGNKYRNLRNNVSRNGSYLLRQYNNRDRIKVLEILKQKGIQYFDSHFMYLDSNIEKFIVTFDDMVQGFLVVSNISSDTFALNASIVISKHRGVGIWAAYQIFVKKKKEGYKYANLGGSEDLGTHTFKEWNYKPTEYLQRIHLIYEQSN